MVGEHIELCVGVVEHLLVARPIKSEESAITGDAAAGNSGTLHASPPVSFSNWFPTVAGDY